MKTYKAVVLEMFGSPDDGYFPGEGIGLVETIHNPGYYSIIKGGKITRDLVSKTETQLYRIIDEIKKVS